MLKLKSIIYKLSVVVKRLFFTEILVLGDSHAEIFRHNAFNKRNSKYFFNVVSVGGATISGLENPNSKTQAMTIFRKNIQKSKANIIIVLLGEVDTGFVIWHKVEKYGLNLSEVLDKAITKYENFLKDLQAKGTKVICISAPLPTIKDNQNFGDVANLRKDIQATQFERTLLTLEFNSRIEQFCIQNNIEYISLDKESIGKNGVVKDELLNTNLLDHHYDQNSYAELILNKFQWLRTT